MRHDEFEQHERAARDVIHAIGRASDDIQDAAPFCGTGDGQGEVLVVCLVPSIPIGAARR